jgi:membrane associated rhomboid family serine protease
MGGGAPEPAWMPGWRDLVPDGPKPGKSEYGLLSRRTGEFVPETRESLIEAARTRTPPLLVWTPEAETWVPVWEVPYLVEAMASAPLPQDANRDTRVALWAGAVLITLGIAVVDAGWGLFAAVLLAGCALLRRVARPTGPIRPEDLRAEADALADAAYRNSKPVPWTRAILGALLATGALQVMLIPAVAAGALSPAALLAGDWWRLFAAPVLHAGVLHWLANCLALLYVGREMETRAPRAWVPIAFLLGALAGGAGSLLPPQGAAMGASGGVMGMVGFLAVLGHRRRAEFPVGSRQQLLTGIALIVMGVLTSGRSMESGVHLGGLLAGVFLGLLAAPSTEKAARWTGGPALDRAGKVALGVIIASAAAAFVVLLIGSFTFP